MSFPLAPVLGGGALAAAVYALYKHFSSSPSEATIKEATAAYTTEGPRGERVFRRDAAQGILRSLPGMGYSHPDPRDLHLVEIHPEKNGTPPAAELSAANWVRAQNRRMSVLASVHLPMPTGASRYLRLAPPGHEAELAPYGYAVLAYADAYHRPSPGQPITGRPPIAPRKSAPVPTPVSAAYAELPPSLHNTFTDFLKKPVKPSEGRALASDLARSGKPAAAAVVEIKTNNATMQAALGKPAIPPGSADATTPLGWVAPVTAVQTLLRSFGATGHDNKPLVVDGKLGPDTRAAIRSFKRMHHLPEDDVVDGATFAALTLALGQRDDAPKGSAYVSPNVMMNPDMYNAATGAQFHNAFMSGKDQKAARKLASQAQGGDRHAMDQIRHDSGLPPGVNDKAKRIAQFAMHVLHQQNGQNVPPGVPPAPPAPFGRHHHHRHWDRSAGASDIDVVTVQQWLSRLNLIPFFGITGQYDALTRQAIRSFQSARGLPANGILDDRTAALLAQAARAAQGASQTTSGFGLYSPPRQNIPLEPIIGPPWR